MGRVAEPFSRQQTVVITRCISISTYQLIVMAYELELLVSQNEKKKTLAAYVFNCILLSCILHLRCTELKKNIFNCV